ncbi:helix-turn-helix domain-containing protein [Niallia sp. 03133]|uniref:helix-turn-helix domain-containing protein n=1 Tax=Niallia sp. 03133 TaxID=3458060 RepID=UPI004043F9D0
MTVNTDILVKADFLRTFIKENNLSESQFADVIGVAHSTVNRILNGKRNPGSKFIAGVLKNFNDLNFDKVFYYEMDLPKGNET